MCTFKDFIEHTIGHSQVYGGCDGDGTSLTPSYRNQSIDLL